MFVEKAIQNLLNDKDIKRSYHADLKVACEKALAQLALKENNAAAPATATESPDKKHIHQVNGESPKVEVNGDVSTDRETPTNSSVLPELAPAKKFKVDIMFTPFELACKSRSSRLVTSSLDSIQKLIAYGHFRHDHVHPDKTSYLENREFDDHLVSTVANCFVGPQTDESVQLQVLKALLTIVTSPHVRVHEHSLLLAVRTCYNIYLASRNLINQTTAKATLNQMLNYIFSTMEADHARRVKVRKQRMKEEGQVGSEVVSSYDLVFPIVKEMVDNLHDPTYLESEKIHDLYCKDAYLVFRSLCKLSMKPLPEGQPDPKSHELRSKILSLQLILAILQNGGEVFQTEETFVSAMKSHLCVALSQNGVSNITEVFELSLALFISLLTKYRKNLKSQIEIFFKEICLNILEAGSSSFEQKWMVVQGIATICCDAQIVIDIYVNYDCDLNAANIFERLVDVLSKLAQGRQSFEVGGTGAGQVSRMRLKGLECLCAILKCMVEWSKDIYVNPHQMRIAEESNGTGNEIMEEVKDLGYDPGQLEKVKQRKLILEHGLRLFAHKPSKGIQYLESQGIHDGTSDSIAQFLHSENARLDKNALGEFLGDLESKETMYAYVDQMNFGTMDFVSALRKFLEGFRLPGEAQKIDRLMEKFASRYCECNPNENIFASADAAYVLAYSIIMLTTDLHSASVKKKMTKEEFIRNNRGINESEDLPKEYLSKIYEEIASSEIKMKSTTSTLAKMVVADAKKRSQLWTRESEMISETAGALMESASSKRDVFTTAKHIEHVKPMFKLIWSPLLATFSVGLQDCDDSSLTQLCIEGMRCAIRIANIFGFSMERNAFIQALARFTLLTDSSSVHELKVKNIEAIKALVSVAHTDGNYLDSSWIDVLKCISQLEYAQMLGNSTGPSSGDGSGGGSKGQSQENLDESGTQNGVNSQSIIVAVDRIFHGSKNLSGDAIVYFFTALCQVSNEEISNGNQPRMFSLVKLVEISYYNMERIRLEWSRIWQVLGHHFNLVGCNESQDISFFAVDSLKQLSMKFLEKGELQNFHFQKDFLRPFEFIMKNNKSIQIRDMVVRCLSQMVQSQAGNIKSGWKNIFSIFSLAASDSEENIVVLSFQTAEQIVTQLLGDSQIKMVDSFQDCVKCLSEYACNQLHHDNAMKAIHLIRECGKFVHDHKEYFLQDEEKEAGHIWVRGWFPVLFELSCIINRSKLDIRTRGLVILFDVVQQYGNSFETGWWKDLFSVLFRIFDVAKIEQQDRDDGRRNSRAPNHQKEWMDTTCNHALFKLTDVFNKFFEKLAPILLPEMLSQYRWCVQQDNDQLSKSAVSCIENLIATNRGSLSEDMEKLVLEFLADLILYTSKPKGSEVKIGRIQVHLEILRSVHKIICGTALKHKDRQSPVRVQHNGLLFASRCFRPLMKLVDSLLSSYDLAGKTIKTVTRDRTDSLDHLPYLIDQEMTSFQCAIDILLELYHDESNSENQEEIEQKLLEVLNGGLCYYLQTSSKSQRENWSELLSHIVVQILNFPDAKFRVAMSVLYSSICDVLSVETTKEFRGVLAKILRRVGTMYNITS